MQQLFYVGGSMEEWIVDASCGRIRGRKTENGYEFLGIPYGMAERFRAPKPVVWDGIRDCVSYGPKAMQPSFLGVKPRDADLYVVGSEDCLNLNVWTKCPDEKARLPVAVYVHGGAFQVGSNSAPERAGDRFMEEDAMVFVSVNYRLGVLGFLQLGEEYGTDYAGSGNNGIKDLLLAVRWVRDHISAFGGDPENITLLGISAGAKAIASLLTLPEFQQVCRRVILESGAMQSFRGKKTADQVTRRYLRYLPEEASLLTLSGEELIQAQAALCGVEGSTCFFGPVLDGELFDSGWKRRWQEGARWRGAAVIGSGKWELSPLAGKPAFAENREQVLEDLFGTHSEIAWNQYRKLEAEGKDQEEAWAEVLSDFMYRYYSDELANQLYREENPVWCYSFEYPPACHGMGFHFLMGQWSLPSFGVTEEKRAEASRISSCLRAGIRRFILTGNPETPELSWEPYRGENKMIFDQSPHMEVRRRDTLTGFTEEVFSKEEDIL